MKRCPECRRDFYDDTLSFCLDDGTPLLEGPQTEEPATAIQASRDSKTALLPENFEITPVTSDNTVSRPILGHWTIVGASVIVLLALAGGIGFAIYKLSAPERIIHSPFASIKIERLTSNGKATQAVISPDGRQVVYVIDDGGKRSLWLRQVATATDVQLVPPADVFYWSLIVSPDGNFLYYVSPGATIENRVLYKMPILGGNPRKVLDNVSSPISFSADGRQIAFARNGVEESALMIANADGTEERKIAVRRGPQGRFGNFFQGGTAWSPDGRRIASIAQSIEGDRGVQNVVEVPVEGGPERRLTTDWYQIQRLAWLSDGTGIVMTAAEEASDFRVKQVWYVSYPGGQARKITNDLNDYGNISLNNDSSLLVTVQSDRDTNIWVAPGATEVARAIQLTSVSSNMDGSIGLAWTPDDKIVYHSMAGGKEGIWIMDVDGKNRKQLTTGETVDFFPSVSPDGRYVVFVSERTGRRGIWRMDIDGSNPKQLSDRGNYPQASTEWVVYQAARNVWRISIDGGEPRKLGENMTWCAISPDEKLVACALHTAGSTDESLVVLPIDGGPSLRVFDVRLHLPARIRWTPDGRSVTYVSASDGLYDIWSQPIAGGEPKRLTNFKADEIFSFDWSLDNRLVISQGESDSDVVLIRAVK